MIQMKIEIDTLEVLVMIFGYFGAKWFFRFILLFIAGKVIGNLKEKGAESLKGFKKKVNQGE